MENNPLNWVFGENKEEVAPVISEKTPCVCLQCGKETLLGISYCSDECRQARIKERQRKYQRDYQKRYRQKKEKKIENKEILIKEQIELLKKYGVRVKQCVVCKNLIPKERGGPAITCSKECQLKRKRFVENKWHKEHDKTRVNNIIKGEVFMEKYRTNEFKRGYLEGLKQVSKALLGYIEIKEKEVV